MHAYRGSYKREEFVYRTRGYGRSELRTNVGLGDDPLVEKLLSLPGVPVQGHLLELGAGDGNGTVHLAERGYQVVGVETSPTAVEMAQRRLKEAGTRNASVLGVDATSLDGLQDDSFDLAVDSGCLHCVVDDEDRRAVLASTLRVLKRGAAWLAFVRPSHSQSPSSRTATESRAR